MNKTLKLTTIATAVISANAFAISGNPSQVNKSEYRDDIVQLIVNGRSFCGGLLVGGEYIVTAYHCVGVNPVDVDKSQDIQVSQGTSYANPDASYDRTFTFYSPERSEIAYGFHKQMYDNYHNNVRPVWGGKLEWEDGKYETDRLVEYYKSRPRGEYSFSATVPDLAILTLDEPVPHKSSAVLSKARDYITGERFVNVGDEFNFMGWGRADEFSPIRENMRKETFEIIHYEADPYFKVESEDEFNDRGIPVTRHFECEVDQEGCTYRPFRGSVSLANDQGTHTTPGDSGTPLLKGDEVYFVASRYNPFTLRTEMVDLSHSMHLFTAVIDGLVYPNGLDVTVDLNETLGQQVVEFNVQNLSETTRVVNPISDQEGVSVLTDCATLEALDSCFVQVEIDEEYAQDYSEISVRLDDGEEVLIDVTTIVGWTPINPSTPVDPEQPETPEPEVPELPELPENPDVEEPKPGLITDGDVEFEFDLGNSVGVQSIYIPVTNSSDSPMSLEPWTENEGVTIDEDCGVLQSGDTCYVQVSLDREVAQNYSEITVWFNQNDSAEIKVDTVNAPVIPEQPSSPAPSSGGSSGGSMGGLALLTLGVIGFLRRFVR